MAIVSVPLKAIIPYHMDSSNEAIPNGWAVADGSTITNPNNTDPASWLQHIVPGANGSYTTPNLFNMFLLGADPAKAATQAGVAVGSGTIDAATGAPGPKGTGGSQQSILTVAQLATHDHGGGAHTHTVNDPGHGHTLTDPGHNHDHTDPGHTHSINDPSHVHPPFHSNPYFAETLAEFAVLPPGGTYNNRINNYSNTTGPAVTGITINSGTTGITNQSATTGATVGSTTTGITINSAGGGASSQGSSSPHENRPRYYGVVYLIKIRN